MLPQTFGDTDVLARPNARTLYECGCGTLRDDRGRAINVDARHAILRSQHELLHNSVEISVSATSLIETSEGFPMAYGLWAMAYAAMPYRLMRTLYNIK